MPYEGPLIRAVMEASGNIALPGPIRLPFNASTHRG
jgi:hypothetical protein